MIILRFKVDFQRFKVFRFSTLQNWWFEDSKWILHAFKSSEVIFEISKLIFQVYTWLLRLQSWLQSILQSSNYSIESLCFSIVFSIIRFKVNYPRIKVLEDNFQNFKTNFPNLWLNLKAWKLIPKYSPAFKSFNWVNSFNIESPNFKGDNWKWRFQVNLPRLKVFRGNFRDFQANSWIWTLQSWLQSLLQCSNHSIELSYFKI